MKTAIFVVIYPGIEPYFNDYLHSLEQQTDKNFVVLICNDGISRPDYLIKNARFEYQIEQTGGTPAEVRNFGINWCLDQGFDGIIFTDADDFFMPNRVEVTKKYLHDICEIVVNDLNPFTHGNKLSPQRLFSTKLENGQLIKLDDIINGNFIGLSNSALRTSKTIRKVLPIPKEMTAYDWVFYSKLLLENIKTVFTNETLTYYRQHSSNTAGYLKLGDDAIAKGIQIKLQHYSYMGQFHRIYNQKYQELKALFDQISANEIYRQHYYGIVRQEALNNPFWWGHISADGESMI